MGIIGDLEWCCLLWYLWPPYGFVAPHSHNKPSSAEAGEHNREALCSRSAHTKYSTEAAVAGARLICQKREDCTATAMRSWAPFSLWAWGRRGSSLVFWSQIYGPWAFILGRGKWIRSIAVLHSLLASLSINNNPPRSIEEAYPCGSPDNHPLLSPHTQYDLRQQPDGGGVPRCTAAQTQAHIPRPNGAKRGDCYLRAKQHAGKHPAVQGSTRCLPARCRPRGCRQL